jgi:UDP-3-O-[3-hydroxymyristoyl] glucosamine N-acyltransferase
LSTTANAIVTAFAEFIQPVSGDLGTIIDLPCSQENPKTRGICFIGDAKYLSVLLQSPIAALVVHTKMVPAVTAAVASAHSQKVILSTKNPKLAMALVNQKFFALAGKATAFDGARIHPTAVIAKSAKVAADAIVAPHAVISEGAIIEHGVFVGAHAFIGTHAKIGARTILHPGAYIGNVCQLGESCEIKSYAVIGSEGFGFSRDEKGLHHHIPHYGGVILGDNVSIGVGTTIDSGTFDPSEIGAGTKIDNQCHLGHNARVGKNVIIVTGFVMAGSVTIGDNCVFGGGVMINGHIKVTSNCQFAPLCGISCDVEKPGVYGGYPPIPVRESLRVQTSIQSLPRIRRQLAHIMKHLGLSDEAER